MMRQYALAAMLLPLALAACGGKPADPAALACPAGPVRDAQQVSQAIRGLQVGDSAQPLMYAPGMLRKVPLSHVGDTPMALLLFQTGVPGCPWYQGRDIITPVAISNGTVVAVGNGQTRQLIERGWQPGGATWPWQDYRFAYIPAGQGNLWWWPF